MTIHLRTDMAWDSDWHRISSKTLLLISFCDGWGEAELAGQKMPDGDIDYFKLIIFTFFVFKAFPFF